MIFNSLTDLAMTERLHHRPHEAVTGIHANTQRQVHYTISPLTYVQKNKLTLPQKVNSVHLEVFRLEWRLTAFSGRNISSSK